MKKIIFTGVFCLLALVLSLTAKAENNVVWLDFSNKVNPVARPLDKLILCVNGCISSKNFAFDIKQKNDSKYGNIAEWTVRSKDKKASGYAALRSGFLEKIEPTPIGVRYVVYASRPEVLSVAAYKGFSRRKGFYRAKRMGERNMTVARSWQNIDLLWKDLGIPPEQYKLVNGFGLIVRKTPFNLKVARIELIFDSASDAAAYKKAKDEKLAKLLKTLQSCVVARGINIVPAVSGKSVIKTELIIWRAIQLLAIGEQVDNWTRIAEANNLQDKISAEKLIEQRKALIGKIESGDLRDIKKELRLLQKNIDSFINSVMSKVPLEKRRWTYGADTRFYRPDGRPYRMFGPFFFRALYAPPRNSLLWRPWDMRYLSGLGFNGIRIVIKWNGLEPEQGKFNKAYLNLLKDIMREAERYGMGVSIDLHWPYPKWFLEGKPGEKPTAKLDKSNSYHWPEALQDSWRRLASELKDIPNIIAFEVPTNETPIASDPKGVMASPVLMKSWNQWLKETYGTREELQSVWGASALGPDRYSLAADENWDDNSIRPIGFQKDESVDDAYANNPRLQDHLRWVAWMQEKQTGGIMKQIRKSIPGAKGMMQRTIGDMWDHSPVPMDYRSIQTCVGDNVLAGTHYGMGSMQARKAAALSLGSYDSEQQMENNYSAVRRQINLGLGFCPFAFHYRGGGGMLLADDEWHLKPEVAYLSINSNLIRNYWPTPAKGAKVAVIVNSRLEATTGRAVDKAVDILSENGCDVGVFESMRIARNPELLKGCSLVVTCSSYMDPRLLSALKNEYKGSVLLNGRLDVDAYVRRQSKGLPAMLADKGLFISNPEAGSFAEACGSIDLSGSWDWAFTGKQKAAPKGIPSGLKWEKMIVPGMWGEEDITGSLQYRIGDGWYKKQVDIPAAWKGRKMFLNLGGVDDIDWVFFNGRLIGQTGISTQNYWVTPRIYQLPQGVIKWGGTNELYICVRNLRGDGGIWKKPVSLSGNVTCMASWADGAESSPVVCLGNTTMLKEKDLLQDVKILARINVPDVKEDVPALLEQGRWFWWIGENWDEQSSSDNNVIRTVLNKIKN